MKKKAEFNRRTSVKESSNGGIYSHRERIKLPTLEDFQTLPSRKCSIEQTHLAKETLLCTSREMSKDSVKRSSGILTDRLKIGRGSVVENQLRKYQNPLTSSVCILDTDRPAHYHGANLETIIRNSNKEKSKLSNMEQSSRIQSQNFTKTQEAMKVEGAFAHSVVGIPQNSVQLKHNLITKSKEVNPSLVKPENKFVSSGFLSQRSREVSGKVQFPKQMVSKPTSTIPTNYQTPIDLSWKRGLPSSTFAPKSQNISPLTVKKDTKRQTLTNPLAGVNTTLSSVQKQLNIDIPSAKGFHVQPVSGVDAPRAAKKLSLTQNFTKTVPHLFLGTDTSVSKIAKPLFSSRESVAAVASVPQKPMDQKKFTFQKIKGDKRIS